MFVEQLSKAFMTILVKLITLTAHPWRFQNQLPLLHKNDRFSYYMSKKTTLPFYKFSKCFFFLQWNTENINYKLDVTNLLVVFISKHQGFYFSMLKKKKNLMWSLHAAAICVWLLRILCDRSLISKRAESWQCSGDVQVDFKADFLLPFSALTRLSLWFVLLKPTVIHTSLSDSVSKKWKQKYNYSLLCISVDKRRRWNHALRVRERSVIAVFI